RRRGAVTNPIDASAETAVRSGANPTATAGTDAAAMAGTDAPAVARAVRSWTQLGQRVAELTHVHVRHGDVRRRQNGGVHHQLWIRIIDHRRWRSELPRRDLWQASLAGRQQGAVSATTAALIDLHFRRRR